MLNLVTMIRTPYYSLLYTHTMLTQFKLLSSNPVCSRFRRVILPSQGCPGENFSKSGKCELSVAMIPTNLDAQAPRLSEWGLEGGTQTCSYRLQPARTCANPDPQQSICLAPGYQSAAAENATSKNAGPLHMPSCIQGKMSNLQVGTACPDLSTLKTSPSWRIA